jgi:hypothetical protein
MFRLISVGVVAIVSLTCAGSAATMRNFKVGDWTAGAYSNDTTRDFSHCAATGTYRSGISVLFSISRDFHWSMGFAHPSWNLRPGAVFDIAFTVDDMPPIQAKARAVKALFVEVDLDESSELFARFRRGRVLRVAAANQVFSFNLTGTAQLLPALLTCAANRGSATQMASNPFETRAGKSSPSNPSGGTADRARETAEATALAANLLSAAGIQGFTLLGPSDRPEIKGDARWLQGDILGTINVMAYVPPGEFKNIPAYLIGYDAKACKGTFFSGAVPDDTVEISRVFTTCQVGGDTSTRYYLAVPRRAGGAYLIATFSAGSEKPAKEADAQLRAVVFKALAR